MLNRLCIFVFSYMCQICHIIGESDISQIEGIKLEEWIDCKVDETRQPILDRIRKNISYHLGNNLQTNKIRDHSYLTEPHFRDFGTLLAHYVSMLLVHTTENKQKL